MLSASQIPMRSWDTQRAAEGRNGQDSNGSGPGSREPQAGCPEQSGCPSRIRPVEKRDELWLLNETLLKHLLNLKMLESTEAKS